MPGVLKNRSRSQGSWSRVGKVECGSDVVREVRSAERDIMQSPINCKGSDVTMTERERPSGVLEREVVSCDIDL